MDFMKNEKIEKLEMLVEACRNDIDNEMQRPFASDYEAWAEVKHKLEEVKGGLKTMEALHKDMWDAVKDRNGEEVCVELGAMADKAREMARLCGTIAAAAEKAAAEV